MAENKEGQEKTEDATPKRLHEARMRGQVSKSLDVTTAAVMLFGGLVVFLLGTNLMDKYREFMKFLFLQAGIMELSLENAHIIYYNIMLFLGKALVPIIVIVFLISFIAEVSQVGLKIANKKFTEGLMFKQVFNPLNGLKRIFFSGRSLFELVKSIFKIFILGGVVFWVLYDQGENIVGLLDKPFMAVATYMVKLSLELVVKVGIVYIIIAVIDLMYQKYRFKEDMKMTKDEIKEERKQAEGDPKVKSRLRQIMRDKIRKIMMKKVEEADVVITNPTHFAVALEYKPGKMPAPRLVSKGADHLAFKIIDLAKENGIPIVEEPPLARTLFYSVDLDQEIPENLFKAVAQVMAYVYRLKNKVVA